MQTRGSTVCMWSLKFSLRVGGGRKGTNFVGFNLDDAFCLSHVGFKRNSEADCLGDQEKGLCIAFTGEQCVLGEVFGSHETLQPKMAISIVRLPMSTFRKETTTTKCWKGLRKPTFREWPTATAILDGCALVGGISCYSADGRNVISVSATKWRSISHGLNGTEEKSYKRPQSAICGEDFPVCLTMTCANEF